MAAMRFHALTGDSLQAALVALSADRPSIAWMPTHVLYIDGRPPLIVREVPGGWEDAGGGFIPSVGAAS